MLDPTPVRQRKRLLALGLGLGTLLVAMVLSTRGLGEGVPGIAGVLGLMYALCTGGLVAGAYVATGVALGAVVVHVLTRRAAGLEASEHRAWLALGIGPGLMLFVSHGLGVMGWLSGPKGQWVAIGTLAAGVVGLVVVLSWAVRARPNLPKPPTTSLLWMLPTGVMLVAASNPPGWLWRSEAAGYDVLSYHLQLAQEWATGETVDRVWPLEHNVYSFLPSAVESGYTHLAAALGAGSRRARTGGAGGVESTGLLAYDGAGAMGCQLLHVAYGLIAAALVGRATWMVLRRGGLGGRVPGELGALAGAMLVATPWMVVVCSMAYVEGAVNAMMAAGLVAAMDERLGPVRRGVLCGVAVGLATACKPTAAFMAAPVVGLVLLAETPMSGWLRASAGAVVGGVAMFGPFLVRNWLASGNPIFPAGTAWFGTAHWTGEQVSRFASAHTETMGLAGRVGLLFEWSGAGGTGLGGEPRGMFHSQWMGLFPIGAVMLGLGLLWRPVHRVSAALAGGLVLGLVWWVSASHCQSRFLLPLGVPLAVGFGIGVGRMASWWAEGLDARTARLAMIVVGAAPLFLSAAATRRFLAEQAPVRAAGMPNFDLPVGTTRRVGDLVKEELKSLAEQDREGLIRSLGPEAYVNNFIDRGEWGSPGGERFDAGGGGGAAGKVYLIGSATPFYFRGAASGRVVYHTTYDRSLLGEAMRAHPGQPEMWSEVLLARGIEHVFVDFSEVLRLSEAGWNDPDVTIDAVAGWIVGWCVPVREWRLGNEAEEQGVTTMPVMGLYRLAAPGGAPRKGRSS
ncbi:MAG: hypothetical protein AB7K52_02805 [Phycisphaerales bacterium]